MIGREKGHENYVAEMIAYMRTVGLDNEQLRGDLTTNAMRFLGLDRVTPNYRKILNYRRENGLNTAGLEQLSDAANTRSPTLPD